MKNPIDCKTGAKIRTPRGTFSVVYLFAKEMNEAGYYFHHHDESGDFDIYGNGTYAFAIHNKLGQ